MKIFLLTCKLLLWECSHCQRQNNNSSGEGLGCVLRFTLFALFTPFLATFNLHEDGQYLTLWLESRLTWEEAMRLASAVRLRFSWGDSPERHSIAQLFLIVPTLAAQCHAMGMECSSHWLMHYASTSVNVSLATQLEQLDIAHLASFTALHHPIIPSSCLSWSGIYSSPAHCLSFFPASSCREKIQDLTWLTQQHTETSIPS